MSAPLPDGTGTILLPFHREAGHLVCLFAQGDTAVKSQGHGLEPEFWQLRHGRHPPQLLTRQTSFFFLITKALTVN